MFKRIKAYIVEKLKLNQPKRHILAYDERNDSTN